LMKRDLNKSPQWHHDCVVHWCTWSWVSAPKGAKGKKPTHCSH